MDKKLKFIKEETMNKNSLLKGAILLSAAFLLAACAPNGSEGSSSEPAESSEKTDRPGESTDSTPDDTDTTPVGDHFFGEEGEHPTVTINLWTTGGGTAQNVLEQFIKGFKEVEPNVEIVNRKVSGNYDQLKSEILSGFSGGNYPDIAYCYPDHVAEYINYGKVVNLDSYINDENWGWTENDLEDVVPAFLEEGQQYVVPGTYSLPFAKSTEAMFYNPVLLEVNLSSIDPTINNGETLTEEYLNNLTWEELFEHLAPALLEYNEQLPAGEKILNPDGKEGNVAVLGYDSDDNLFITLAKQYGYGYTSITNEGKGHVDFNNEGMKDLMRMLNGAYLKGYFITKGSNDGEYVNTLFTQNDVLFSIGSTGGIDYQYGEGNDWVPKVARVPQAIVANRDAEAIMSQGPGLTILNHPVGSGSSEIDTDRIWASWLFYKYATNELNAIRWSLQGTGYMPIRYSVYESSQFQQYTDETGKTGLDLLKARGTVYYQDATEDMFTSPVFLGSSECRTQAGSIVTQCIQAGANLESQIDSIFETAANNAALAIR